MNDVLSEAEVAVILDCEPKTIQEKARNGTLPAVKFGRSWIFPRNALLQSLNEMALANKPKTHQVTVPAKSRRAALPTLT